MRLMLGNDGIPCLLVDVAGGYNPKRFSFDVINGAWEGEFVNGYITVYGPPGGDYSSLDKKEILCDNQDRLRGDYQDVFANFDNVDYVSPSYVYQASDDDDDVPF